LADKKKTIVTMEGLLQKSGFQVRGFKRGQTVTGKVVEVTGRTVYINVGGKAEAIVAEKEYDMAKDYFRSLKPGDEVTGVVLMSENEAGQAVLSLKRAAADSKWKMFEQAMAEEQTLVVKVKSSTRGGLLVEIDGVFGFIPSSQIGHEYEDNQAALVGKDLRVKVVEVSRDNNRLVFSEKAVSEAEEIEKKREALSAVVVGGEYEGIVVGVVPFGVFVEVIVPMQKLTGELRLEGLVHISELSWEKIEEVNKFLKEGDKVTVQVIGTDEESGKLALSVKRLTSDPWLVVKTKYPTDSKHKGKVTKLMPYGVLVRVEKGIEGLIHASKLPAEKTFKEGDEVEVFVESVDVDKRRLSLGVVVQDTKGMIYK